MPDKNNQVFTVPGPAKFTIDGREKTVFDLRKGMKIKATVVTDEEHTLVEQSELAYGRAPQINLPREIGVLLFGRPLVTLASADQLPPMLPETASSLPLLALLGTLAIGRSLLVGVARRSYAR